VYKNTFWIAIYFVKLIEGTLPMKTIILSLMIIINVNASENNSIYTWNNFIQKALDVSFSIKQDDAQILIEKEKITQSTLLENPTFAMAFDDGLEGGVDYTYLEVSQKLPTWGENDSKKKIAKFESEHAFKTKQKRVLQVQYKAALLFQKLHTLKVQFSILEEQLKKVKLLEKISMKREASGDISGLEPLRINIMKQQVITKIKSLESRYLKVQLEAQSLLHVEGEVIVSGEYMKSQNVQVNELIKSLEQSPEYLQSKNELQVAKEKLVLTKAMRYASPELYMYSERDFNRNNQVDDFYGVGFRIAVPLWNRQESQIQMNNVQIQKSNLKYQEVLYKLQRDVKGYYELYTNKLNQLEDYEKNLLKPAKKYYEVNTFSFEFGEVSLLELLDAQTLYLQSQLEYQDFVAQSNFYWLQLCDAASINLLKDN
jgi:cobalt-zinc-cadmium efflux system outer membrane protein